MKHEQLLGNFVFFVALFFTVTVQMGAVSEDLHLSSPKTSIVQYEPIFFHVKGTVPKSTFLKESEQRFQNERYENRTSPQRARWRLPNLTVVINDREYPLSDFMMSNINFGVPLYFIQNAKEAQGSDDRLQIEGGHYMALVDPEKKRLISSDVGTLNIYVKTEDGSTRSNTLTFTVQGPERKVDKQAARFFSDDRTLFVFGTRPSEWENNKIGKQGLQNLRTITEKYGSSIYAKYAFFLRKALDFYNFEQLRSEFTEKKKENRKKKLKSEREKIINKFQEHFENKETIKKMEDLMDHLPQPSRWHLFCFLMLKDVYYGRVKTEHMSAEEYIQFLKSKQNMYPSDVMEKRIQYIEKKLKKSG